MPGPMTIYRCSTFGALEVEHNCTKSTTGKTWTRVDNGGEWVRRFSSGLGWTDSRKRAASQCFSFWSAKRATAQRQSAAASAAMDDYRAMMEQDDPNY